MNYDKMTPKELRDEAAKLMKMADDREVQVEKDFIAKMREEARELGLDFSAMMGAGKPKRTVAPKYQHPENPSLTWTGRGRAPKWIQEAKDAGEDLKKFEISN